MPDPASDDNFARHLLKMGLVTEAQVQDARRAQQGKAVPIGDILVEKGLLTAAQRENILRKLESQREESHRLGPYRILKKLGEGGMGVVYLAEDPATHAQVALKVLPKEAGKDETARQRFSRELASAQKLQHRNIVHASGGGEDKGWHYYVMEYVEGETLGARLKRHETFSPVEATKLVVQVAAGLQHAHGLGFIHRDIKPDNVIVSREGIAKILDMGLSKNIDESQTFQTVSGVALGTPHYISPEQARSEKTIDGRADIYSLGATYYHLVTGETPFRGTTVMEVIAQHLNMQLPDPRDVRDGIPDEVVTVIRRMMAKRPDDRYRDCAELKADLEHVAAGRPLTGPELDPARSTIALPLQKEARERFRAQKLREKKPPTIRTTRQEVRLPSTKKQLLIGGGISVAVLVIAMIALTSGGTRRKPAAASETGAETTTRSPSTVRKVEARAPTGEAERSLEEVREESARRKLNEITAADKSGQFTPEEIRRRYQTFAEEFAGTPQGRTVKAWLRDTGPKPEAPPIEPPPPAPEPSTTPVPADPAPPAPAPEPPRRGLVGRWMFLEGSGSVVADASGNGHVGTIIGSPKWVRGTNGGLAFDRTDGYVQFPNSPSLDRLQADSYTVCARFRPNAFPAGQVDPEVRYAIFAKLGWHEGLTYRSDRRFSMDHWLEGRRHTFAGSRTEFAVGQTYHVAGVVDRQAGKTRLYVDGRLEGEGSWTPGAAAHDYRGELWRAGIAGPALQDQFRWAADGVIVDARLYDRALTAAEIAALAELKEAPAAATPAVPAPDRAPKNWKNAIDLLEYVDLQRDVVTGVWSLKDGVLRCSGPVQGYQGIRMEIPYRPPAEYDFRIEFVRMSPMYDVTQILSKDGRSFSWNMDAYNERGIFGFQKIAAGSPQSHPSNVARPHLIQGRKYVSIVEVRNDVVRTTLDGELITQWKTDYREAQMEPFWVLRRNDVLGLGAWNTQVEFHSVQLVEVTGRGAPLYAPRKELPRMAVPDAAQLRDAEKAVQEIRGSATAKRSSLDRQALAMRLREEAKVADNPAHRYALLSAARDEATAAGDTAGTMAAVDALETTFALDGAKVRLDALTKLARTLQTQASVETFVRTWLDLIDDAIADDDLDLAKTAAKQAVLAAGQMKNAELASRAQSRMARIASLERDYRDARDAARKLETEPENPAACLSLGRYHCLSKGDWNRGLPLLAKGPEDPLKAAAAMDLDAPTDPLAQAEVCKAWLGLAEKERNLARRTQLLDRARLWQGRSGPKLAEAVRTGLARRADALDKGIQIQPATVDLLRMVDPKKDGLPGKQVWAAPAPGTLTTPNNHSGIQFPYVPPEEYDLRILVERTDGGGRFVIGMASGTRQVGLVLDQAYIALENVDGRDANNSNPTKVNGMPLPQGKPRAVTCSVRRSSVTVTIDGEIVLHWQGGFDRLSLHTLIGTPPDKSALFLGCSSGGITVHKAVVTPLWGEGYKLR